MTVFKKKLLVLRQQLIGAGYHNALEALAMARTYHTGLRKDGETPEFQHQVEIALYALTLPNLKYREEVIATIMLHDTREDYGVSDQEVYERFSDPEMGKRVSRAVSAMTKEFRGERRDEQEVFADIAANEIASIAKGCDRIHNLQSMVGVFTPEKQRIYIEEVHAYFLPMLKSAREEFPSQHLAYENIKFVLLSQIQLIEANLASLEKAQK